MAPSPAALIVVSPPKNQRCSPVPGCCAMGVRVVMCAACSARRRATIPRARGSLLHAVRHFGRWARSVEALIDEIDLLACRGLPRKQFFAELAPRVRTVLDNDASCWRTLDPHAP